MPIIGLLVAVVVLVIAVALVRKLGSLKAGLANEVSFTALTRGEVEAPIDRVFATLADIQLNELRDVWGHDAVWVDESLGRYHVKDPNGNTTEWLILEEQAPTRTVRQYEGIEGRLRGILEIDLDDAGPGPTNSGLTRLSVTHHADMQQLIHKMFGMHPMKEHALASLLIEGIGKALEVPARVEKDSVAMSEQPLVVPMAGMLGEQAETNEAEGRFDEERV